MKVFMPPIEWLQKWYSEQCDDDWEHSFGIEISTLDNPGWRIQIDIAETNLEGMSFESVKIDRTKDDWYHCWLEGGKFQAACGPRNLLNILTIFAHWAQTSQSSPI